MDRYTLADYHAERRKGRKASDALGIARSHARIRALPYYVENGTEFEHDGFDVSICVCQEEDTDISWLGEFTDNPHGKFAFERKNAAYGECKYFVPAADNGRNLKDYRNGYRKTGYARHAAHLAALRDLKSDWIMAEDICENGQWSIGVSVLRNGLTFGYSSVGAVDAGWIASAYLEYKLLDEAIAEAKRNAPHSGPITCGHWTRGERRMVENVLGINQEES